MCFCVFLDNLVASVAFVGVGLLGPNHALLI
jgi:hypothetical protein